MRKHFITGASRNSSEALSMAKGLWERPFDERGYLDGVQEMVEVINTASIKLRSLCERHDYRFAEARDIAMRSRRAAAIADMTP